MGGFYSANQLGNLEIGNQIIPNEGPRAIPLNLDFTNATGKTSYLVDLSVVQYQTRMSMVQTVYIDLSGTDSPLEIQVQGTNQTVTAKGRTQGYYNVLAPAPTRLQITCLANAVIPVALINVPIAGAVWPTQ
jgi:hypothetical protein